MLAPKRILFGLTGSIACYKSCAVISALIKGGHDVQIVASKSALNFVGVATLEGLSGKPVMSESFTTGHMMDHIRLAREADLFIIAPLTAHHAAILAHGLADDFISTLALAYEPSKPFIVAPAMNGVMWQAPVVQKNIEALAARRIQILSPNDGVLACGEEGTGKMQEPEQLLAAIEAALNPKNSSPRVLVTFGGTREVIDGVRSLANTSTGHTGAQICDALLKAGFRVFGLHGRGAELPKSAHHRNLELKPFGTAQDLDHSLRETLALHKFNAVIHLAAISDFAIDYLETNGNRHEASENLKLSSNDPLTIVLKPAKKILHSIKEYAQDPNLPVIAFKLTKSKNTESNRNAAQKLFSKKVNEHSTVDFVVHNDENDINRARGEHRYRLISLNGRDEVINTTNELANKLSDLVRTLPGGH